MKIWFYRFLGAKFQSKILLILIDDHVFPAIFQQYLSVRRICSISLSRNRYIKGSRIWEYKILGYVPQFQQGIQQWNNIESVCSIESNNELQTNSKDSFKILQPYKKRNSPLRLTPPTHTHTVYTPITFCVYFVFQKEWIILSIDMPQFKKKSLIHTRQYLSQYYIYSQQF